MENVIKGGIDIGNKNLKVYISKDTPHELAIAYSEITADEYAREVVGEETERVAYRGKYYHVGLGCNRGLPQNKGDIDMREEASMIKLVGLARELRLNNQTEGVFKLVSGTPVEDFEVYKDDYMDLLVSPSGDYEEIEIDDVVYRIKVADAYITKQSACLAPTIPEWKTTEFLLVDFGGGTLDVAHFANGVRSQYLTLNFPLNNVLAELGNALNAKKLGLPRPDALDSNFLKSMETVVMKGKYKNESKIKDGDKEVPIEDFVKQWLQDKINNLMVDIKMRLNFSTADCNAIQVYFFGGGSKLLEKVLLDIDVFANKKVFENPHFANVIIYHTIANSRKDWVDND